MKKFICILISVFVSILCYGVNTFANDNIEVFINGEIVKFDTQPTIINGRTFVPIRAVCEKLGADVYWHSSSNTVFIIKNDKKISIQTWFNEMIIMNCKDFEHYYELRKNDKMEEYTEIVKMDVAPLIQNGRTLLPIRYVCEALGANVAWDAKTSTVNIICSDNILQVQNQDKSFFDKYYYCDEWPDDKILATAQTNDERIEKAIYFLELCFKTNALVHNEVSPIDDLYFEIRNTAIYKLNSEYPQYYDVFDDKYEVKDGRNIDYIVEFEGETNEYHHFSDEIYSVTFYKDGTCGLGVELEGIDGKIENGIHFMDTCPPEIKVLIQDYDVKYNKLITYPSSDGGVKIFC